MKPRTQIRPVLVVIAAAVTVSAIVATAASPAGAARLGPAPPAAAAAETEWGPTQDLGNPHGVNWFGRVVLDSTGTAIAVWVQGAWEDRSAVMSTRPPGGTWSQLESIPGTSGASEVTLAIDATDDLVLGWTHGRRVLAQRRPADGEWTTPVVVQRTPRGRLGTYPRYLELAVSPGGRAVLAWQPYDDDADPTYARVRSEAAIGRPSGTWSRVVTLSGERGVSLQPQVVAGPDATARAFWLQSGRRHSRVLMATNTREEGWSQPRRLSPRKGRAGVPRVAATSIGDLAVLWSHDRGETRTLTVRRWTGEDGWLPRSDRPLRGNAWYDIGVDDAGTAAVAWARWAGIMRVADQLPEGTWTEATKVVDARPHTERVELVTNAAGDAVLAWGAYTEGEGHVVQAATRTASGAWSAATDLSALPGGASLGAVAMRPDGEAAALWTWSADRSGTSTVQARTLAIPAAP